MDRNGENWTGDDIAEKATAPGGAHEDASGEKPADDSPEDFRPEGAEIEPAGGIVKKAPAPEEPVDPPTEGDKR